MKRCEQGFTLIEAIISLIILSILSLNSVTFVVNLHDYIQLNRVLAVFQADLHDARDVNMMQLSGQQRRIIRIYHNENRYVILDNNIVQVEREFPRNITVARGQHALSEISFNDRGNLGVARTFVFSSSYHTRSVVFSIGTGGFDVR